MGLVTTAEEFAVFEARNSCTAFSCTAIQYNSQSAQGLLHLLLKAGKSFSCQQDATSLFKRQTHSCYSLLRLHIHLAPSFECSILSRVVINKKQHFLSMSKGFCCPFLSSSLPLIMHRRTLQLWADLPTLIPNARKHNSVHTSCFNYDHFGWKKWIQVAPLSCNTGSFKILLIQKFTSDHLV